MCGGGGGGGGGGDKTFDVCRKKCLLTYSTGSGSLYSNEEYEVAKAEGDG